MKGVEGGLVSAMGYQLARNDESICKCGTCFVGILLGTRFSLTERHQS